jgi:hypothetical protein
MQCGHHCMVHTEMSSYIKFNIIRHESWYTMWTNDYEQYIFQVEIMPLCSNKCMTQCESEQLLVTHTWGKTNMDTKKIKTTPACTVELTPHMRQWYVIMAVNC